MDTEKITRAEEMSRELLPHLKPKVAAPSRTLFDISEDLIALGELLAEVGGEITEGGASEALDKFFAELGAARNEKLDNYAMLIKELDARASIRKQEAGKLSQHAKADENLAARLRARLFAFFKIQGMDKLRTRRNNFSVCNNGGKLALEYSTKPEHSAEILAQTPNYGPYTKTTYEFDNKAIRESLDAGLELPFVKYAERGKQLRIS